MDVRFLFFGLDRTGGTLVALRFIEALLQADHRVTVATLGRPGDQRFLVPPSSVEVTYLGLRARPYKALVRVLPGELGFPLLEMRRLGRAVGAPDLVVATYSLTAAPAVRSGRPVHYHAQHFEPLIVPGRRAVELARSSYRLDTYLTANSTWVANRIADAGGDVRGIVTPGIDLKIFSPGDDGLPSMQPLRVITLGKAVAWKGLVDVVEGVRRFAAAHKGGVELVTYGPDAPAGTAGLNHRHVGLIAQPELAALYRSSSVCVSGSWYESFPLPPIEAMATGVPVILQVP
jgi:glycosyltransferase involved in cell wall biosynthesis